MNNIKAFIYKDMKRNATFKVLLMFIVGLFLSVNTFAQQIVVKGIVKDTTGEPIIGANVIVKGTTNGTITDFDGNFLLNANKGDIIIISFIGYRSQEAQAAASMNIILRWVLSIPFFISCIRQQNPLTVLSKIILRKVKQFNLPPQKK